MKRAQHAIQVFAALLVCVFFALAMPPSARAQDNQDNQVARDSQGDITNVRIARLSFVVGEVRYQQGQEDWQPAAMNLPIQKGYKLATGNGRAEIEFESGLIVRLADDSELDFTQLALLNGGRITQLTVAAGTVIVSASLNANDALSIVAPNLQVSVSHTTRFRVDTAQGDSWVAVMKGDVSVSSAAGDSRVAAGHTLHISGANPDQINVDKNPDPDDFDNWAADRDGVLQQENSQAMEAFAAAQDSDLEYTNYNYGLGDLYGYGSFVNIAGYGLCWQPYGVSTLWMPFWRGAMVFVPGFGWTWISNEPWGWLPYHTGHWFNVGGRGWFWKPGPARHWNPAPVNWIRVGNQLGWTPRGESARVAANGGPWVVTGNAGKSGEIRPIERFHGGQFEVATGAPPAAPPSAARSFQSESGASGSQTGTVSRPPANPYERGPIHLDPRTNTYENGDPPERPVRTMQPLVRQGETSNTGAQRDLRETQ
ncbi:MAG TPA: FecR family protein, partial [Candidatus Acidoferrum sp.]|nr:FecR family protein [Candidatus Acidoferrum sp.]